MSVWSELESTGLLLLEREATRQPLNRDVVEQAMFLIAAARNRTAAPPAPDLSVFDDGRLRQLATVIVHGPRYYDG